METKKTCETCINNDDYYCDKFGFLVDDEDEACNNYKSKNPEWKQAMMRTFLAGH